MLCVCGASGCQLVLQYAVAKGVWLRIGVNQARRMSHAGRIVCLLPASCCCAGTSEIRRMLIGRELFKLTEASMGS